MKKIPKCFPTTQIPTSKLRITTNIPHFCNNSQRDHYKILGDIRKKCAESTVNREIVKNEGKTIKCVSVGYICVFLHVIYTKCFPTKFYLGKHNLFVIY